MAPQVRIEPPPSGLLLSQYAIFEVLLIRDNFHIGSLDERAGQNVSMVILIVFFFFYILPYFKVYINIHNYAN